MNKSPKNKTIDTEINAGREYLDRCLRIGDVKEPVRDLSDTIICADMFATCKFIPAGSADLMIVDPPYNLTKDYSGESFRKMKPEEYEEYTRRWIDATSHVLKENGSVYVCCDWESSLIIGKLLSEHYTVRNRITWQREKGRGSDSNWKNSMEDIWFATKSDEYTFNIDDVKIRRKVIAPYRNEGEPKDWEETENGKYRNTHPSNFWDDITVPFWSMAENTAHPAQKPEKLMAKLILASSVEGDLVFDPFAGSGSACVTAKKLGRHFIGIEKNERYCVWAQQRLEMAEKDRTIQGYEEGVFWERNSRR
ncbi:MAG: site-specific DNA-methyltransferase [Firmicutes bacterium]|nr:site-specific DNA-methyltransferase [Bacillota bacterium]